MLCWSGGVVSRVPVYSWVFWLDVATPGVFASQNARPAALYRQPIIYAKDKIAFSYVDKSSPQNFIAHFSNLSIKTFPDQIDISPLQMQLRGPYVIRQFQPEGNKTPTTRAVIRATPLHSRVRFHTNLITMENEKKPDFSQQ